MAYEIRITRGEDTPISLDEWREVVAADPTLDADEDDQAAAHWNRHPDEYELPGFQWAIGDILIQRPDDHTVGKAVELARRLRAHVIDDGEVIREPPPVPAKAPRPPLTDRQKLLRRALKRAGFKGVWVRRGILPRRARISVHTMDGHNHFLIVLYRDGPLRDIDHDAPIDVMPLSSDVKIEPNRFLGRTVGFVVESNDGTRIAVRVDDPETWIRFLRHPDQPVTLQIRG